MLRRITIFILFLGLFVFFFFGSFSPEFWNFAT
jgi:hypothetical protein